MKSNVRKYLAYGFAVTFIVLAFLQGFRGNTEAALDQMKDFLLLILGYYFGSSWSQDKASTATLPKNEDILD